MKKNIILVLIIFIVLTGIYLLIPITIRDWKNVFYPVSLNVFHPYKIAGFINPPWVALILAPFSIFSLSVSSAANSAIASMVVVALIIKRKGTALSLFLSMTSFPFFSLITNGNIDWIPLIGFIIQNQWGIIFLLAKPQTGSLVIFDWIKRKKIKEVVLFFLPTAILIFLSLLVWKNWPRLMVNSIVAQQSRDSLLRYSLSPFPYGIPFGLGLIYYVLKYHPKDSEILATLSTFLLIPYFAPHSLIILFILISLSHRKLSIVLWILLWIFPFWYFFIK